MTQEEKRLLIKDLCARLPYGVKLKSKNGEVATLVNPPTAIQDDCWNFKPYLRPLSSMSEEEEIYYNTIYTTLKFYEKEDWLNEHHFDYRLDPSTGKTLIESGLALEAKEGMYKND